MQEGAADVADVKMKNMTLATRTTRVNGDGDGSGGGGVLVVIVGRPEGKQATLVRYCAERFTGISICACIHLSTSRRTFSLPEIA